MINVSLFSEVLSPQIDGVAITVENYARILNEVYGICNVIVPKYPDRTIDKFLFPVWEYPSARINKDSQYMIGIPISSSLRHKLKDEPIDIIHSHCPFVSGLFAQRVAARKNVPHITTFHSKYKEDINQRFKYTMGIPGELVSKYISAFYNRCDYVWTVSYSTADTLRGYGYKGDIIVIPNGCDMPVTNRDTMIKGKIFKIYEFTQQDPLLLFVGRLTWTKNIKIIIKSLGALAKSGQKFNMLFVGDGEDNNAIRDMVNDEGISHMIKFAGKISERNTLKDIYASSDLFLFPSVYDNAPLVVREAAACGCASVMISGSNAAESALNGINAFLSRETVEDFAITIKIALENYDLYKIGQNACRDMYISWENVLKQVVSEYEKILVDWEGKKNKNANMQNFKDSTSNIDIIKEYNLHNHEKIKNILIKGSNGSINQFKKEDRNK